MRIELDRVAVTYPGGIPGLHETTARVEGRIIGVLGHNASGKSTLIRVLAGSLPPTQGAVSIDGQPVAASGLGWPRAPLRLSYFPQELPNFPLAQTPHQTLSHSLLLARATDPVRREEMTDTILDLVGLRDVKDRPVATFSGGMKQKVRIAQALVHNPTLLILDEPTTGLDVQERLSVLRLLHRLSARMPVLFSTHDCHDVAAICETAMILVQGRLVATGSPEDLTARVNGQVWEWVVRTIDDLPQNELCVTRLHRREGGIKVRAVGAAPPPGAVAVSPTLEDAYAYLTRAAER